MSRLSGSSGSGVWSRDDSRATNESAGQLALRLGTAFTRAYAVGCAYGRCPPGCDWLPIRVRRLLK